MSDVETGGGRERMPARRSHDVTSIVHAGMVATIGTGRHADGRLGEVFVDVAKVGTALEALGKDASILVSIALQHGASIDELRHSMSRQEDGAPQSLIGAVLDEIAGGAS